MDGNRPVIEAVGGGDEDPRCEDGGGAHEVRLARALPQEQRGQPGEAAVLGLRGPGAVLVSPHDAAPPGALLRPGIGVNNNITTSVRGIMGIGGQVSIPRHLYYNL